MGDGVVGASEKLLVVGVDEGDVLAVDAVHVVLGVVVVSPQGLSDPAEVLRGLVSVEVIVLDVGVVVPSSQDASVLGSAVDPSVEADCLVVVVLSRFGDSEAHVPEVMLDGVAFLGLVVLDVEGVVVQYCLVDVLISDVGLEAVAVSVVVEVVAAVLPGDVGDRDGGEVCGDGEVGGDLDESALVERPLQVRHGRAVLVVVSLPDVLELLELLLEHSVDGVDGVAHRDDAALEALDVGVVRIGIRADLPGDVELGEEGEGVDEERALLDELDSRRVALVVPDVVGAQGVVVEVHERLAGLDGVGVEKLLAEHLGGVPELVGEGVEVQLRLEVVDELLLLLGEGVGVIGLVVLLPGDGLEGEHLVVDGGLDVVDDMEGLPHALVVLDLLHLLGEVVEALGDLVGDLVELLDDLVDLPCGGVPDVDSHLHARRLEGVGGKGGYSRLHEVDSLVEDGLGEPVELLVVGGRELRGRVVD